MSKNRDRKVPENQEGPAAYDDSAPEGQDESGGRVMDDVKAFISSDGGSSMGPGDGGGDDLDDLMTTKRTNVTLVMFLVGLLIVLGLVGYVLVNEEARTKIAGFIRGDLFRMEKQRAEDLQKMYIEKMEQLDEKYGDIRLEYFPRNARIYIYQRMMRFEDINDRTPEEWANPKEIPNLTAELKEGEELPFLSIENLPVREKGKLCPANGQFYAAHVGFCPGHEACIDQMGKEGEEANETCIKNALKSVQYCPQDDKYYLDEGIGVMVCPDGKTLMDPSRVPIFVFQYNFLFEAKDFIPQVVSYAETDWIHLGSGKYIIPFPKDFSLLRAWGPLKKKYAELREKMRCWRLAWEDEWEEYKRMRVKTLVREKVAEAAKAKEERTHGWKAIQAKYQKSLDAVDVVRKVKTMGTIRNGAAEIFWYCSEPGNCDAAKMDELIKSTGKMSIAELDDFEKGIFYGVLQAMKNNPAKWDGMQAFLDSRPVLNAGLLCLQSWLPNQKEGQFVEVKEKECLSALSAIQGADPYAYKTFQQYFLVPDAGKAEVAAARNDLGSYLLSVDEYEGGEKYEDLIFRIDASGKFIEFLSLAILYDYDAFTEAMVRFAQSRLVNYRRDAEKRGVVPSDVFKGMKEAMELAWWTGSRFAFDDWYWRLWTQDVQGCLLFAKETDRVRYERDLKKFGEMVGAEKSGMREQAKGFKDFLRSLRGFAVARPLLREANALYKGDRKGFFSKYSEQEMVRLKTEFPEFYYGLLYLSDPRNGKDYMDGLVKLPEAQSWETPKVEGDQKEYHKYLAYMELFDPTKVETGMAVLARRMEPMFMTEYEYGKLAATRPDLPPYKQAIREIVASDIHIKYFWLLGLLESPSKFEREFSRLELKEALEVAKWTDPVRYSYLSDLVWMEEMVERYEHSVPMLTDALTVDFGLYQAQVEKLKAWSDTKSKIVRKYRRGKKLSESLLKEPYNVEKALDKYLRQANRYALLAKNLEDFEEATLSTIMAAAMEELRDEFDAAQRDSYAKHVEGHNDKMRIATGFTKKEWDSLTSEFERTPANAEWYGALSGRLANRRLDCSKLTGFEPQVNWKKEIRGEE